ncbi:TatD family hydrolase [Helicobacter sp. MIT 21-1697]|uniref:TatD family hydrolase n=1 Tax=Helicobacter sp. MIT 21-1697 TaxID=2993733 RepID=UPI00224AC230|nr:TatD family hydrolase [Helicobacter sp. MIT 21-1697]MCX2717215.1 TatD family hydrolase [Helicobacter sp. MIT 21-1697]
MIDTHCHLDSQSFANDLEQVIARAFEQNVAKIIIPGADIRTLPLAQSIAHTYENVYFAAGVHPNEIDNFDIAVLEEYAKDEKCIAIGECGLDYHYLPQDSHTKEQLKAQQKQCFIAQIELALKLQKPLIVHIREASTDSFAILDSYKEARGVLHCYNADRILLELSERFYYGIGGVCTFKNARRLIEVLPLIPKERIVLETDAPYLTPHPYRGTRNEPHYIPLIMRQIAQVLDMSEEQVIDTSTRNAITLFKEIQ